MALDSTLDEVADTPTNALHFGRLSAGPSQSPFPQVRCLYLAEVGTHAIVDALFAPAHTSEQRMAPVLLRSLTPDMLLLFDRNFVGAPFLHRAHATGAHLLGRLASNRYRHPERLLADGSYLISLPADEAGQPPLQLRVIEYRVQPLVAEELAQQPVSRTSAGSDPRAVHRLVTTLLKSRAGSGPRSHPALPRTLGGGTVHRRTQNPSTPRAAPGTTARTRLSRMLRHAAGPLCGARLDASRRPGRQPGPRPPQFHPCHLCARDRYPCMGAASRRGTPPPAASLAG